MISYYHFLLITSVSPTVPTLILYKCYRSSNFELVYLKTLHFQLQFLERREWLDKRKGLFENDELGRFYPSNASSHFVKPMESAGILHFLQWQHASHLFVRVTSLEQMSLLEFSGEWVIPKSIGSIWYGRSILAKL